MTPTREIAELNIGSRPSACNGIASHRGSARNTLGVQLEPEPYTVAGLAQLQATYQRWPFFRGLMSNMDMVLR